MKKKPYFVRMVKHDDAYTSEIVTYNGHIVFITQSFYLNKAQCRNVGKKFADKMGLEWRE